MNVLRGMVRGQKCPGYEGIKGYGTRLFVIRVNFISDSIESLGEVRPAVEECLISN